MNRALAALLTGGVVLAAPLLWTSCGGDDSDSQDAGVALDATSSAVPRVLLHKDFAGNQLEETWVFEELGAEANHRATNDRLEIWTPSSAPAYYAAPTTRARRVLEAATEDGKVLKLVATIKGIVPELPISPSLTVGLVGSQQSLFKFFGGSDGFFCEFGGQSGRVESDRWYKLTLTFSATQTWAALRRADNGAVVFESAGAAVPQLSTLASFQLEVSVNDVAQGEARVLLDDVYVEQAP